MPLRGFIWIKSRSWINLSPCGLGFGMITNSMISQTPFSRLIVIRVAALVMVAMWLMAAGQVGVAQDAKDGLATDEIERAAEQFFQEAITESQIGDPKSGLRRFDEAARLWMQVRQPEKAARAAVQLGDSFKLGKSYYEALSCFRKALVLKESASIKAIALNSIGKVYAELFLRPLATRYFEKAIKEARIARDLSTQAAALIGLARVHYELGEMNQALSGVLRARTLIPWKGDDEVRADSLHLSGQIEREKGLAKQARMDFDRALSVYLRIRDIDGEIRVLCSQSNLDLTLMQNEAALAGAEHALKLADKRAKGARTNAEKLKARESRGRAWLGIARADRALGRMKPAIAAFENAIFHLEGEYWSAHISTESSAIAFREENQAPYRELVDLLVEQGQIKEAYERAEKAKARTILGMTAARRERGPDKTVERDANVDELSRSISRLRTQLVLSDSEHERSKLQREINDKELELEEAQLHAEMDRSRERMSWFKTAEVKKLQESINKSKSTIVEFFLGEKRSFAWLVSSSGVSMAILPGKSEIENSVTEYFALINTAPNYLYTERDLHKATDQAATLFSSLLGELAQRIEVSGKLVIVPDGVLHYLPFEALIQNGRYLLEDHEISYLPSASMLGLWQTSPEGAAEPDRMELLAFGDPTFGPDPKRYSGRAAQNPTGVVARQLRASRGFHLAQLPRTRDEVEYISGLFPHGQTRVYLGPDSTEDALKGESLRRYRRLHFATHSLINESSPSRSAVVLAIDSDPAQDGLLEVREISELDLDCDLVVLSACQTARGQLLSGEGVVGLTRAFLYAGARSVVVSLWSVTDISTGQLMKRFYCGLADNLGTAAALRAAKLKMLRAAETRHPYYWSPFVAIGKP